MIVLYLIFFLRESNFSSMFVLSFFLSYFFFFSFINIIRGKVLILVNFSMFYVVLRSYIDAMLNRASRLLKKFFFVFVFSLPYFCPTSRDNDVFSQVRTHK